MTKQTNDIYDFPLDQIENGCFQLWRWISLFRTALTNMIH